MNLRNRRRLKSCRNFADSAPSLRSMITRNPFPRSLITTSRPSTVPSSHKYGISMQYNVMGGKHHSCRCWFIKTIWCHKRHHWETTTNGDRSRTPLQIWNIMYTHRTDCSRGYSTCTGKSLYINGHLIKDWDTEAQIKFTNLGTNDKLSRFATRNNWWFWSQ